MASWTRAVALHLVALLLASAGCIQPTTQLLERPADASSAGNETAASTRSAGSSNASSPRAGAAGTSDGPGPVELNVEIRADEGTASNVELSDVDADGLDAAPASTGSGPVAPGQTLTVLRVERAPGEPMDPFNLTLRLDDGLGPAHLVATIGSWSAGEDATVTLTLGVREEGVVQVTLVEADLDVDLPTRTSQPAYGYMVWPSGTREPMPAFAHVIHVPAGYPDLPAGEQVTFRLDPRGSPGAARWRLDGEAIGQGRSVEIAPDPGRHVLALRLGEQGPSRAFTFAADLNATFQGTLHAGTGPVDRAVDGVNSARIPLEIQAGAAIVAAGVAPQDGDGPTVDLDLYLRNATGSAVAQSARDGNATEVIDLPGDQLLPGGYTLEVRAVTGAEVAYNLTATVDYR